MPQMSPLNWLFLFIFFSIIFILLNSINYFIINYSSNSFISLKSPKLLNWKW